MNSSSLTLQRHADSLLAPRPSILGLAGRRLLQLVGLHPIDRDAAALDGAGLRALCVATSHGELDVGVPTGVFASELTVPYYVFVDAGLQVDVASPRGGLVPVEPMSLKEAIRTPADDRLLGDGELRAAMGQAAQARCRDRFGIAAVAGAYHALYEELAGAACAAS